MEVITGPRCPQAGDEISLYEHGRGMVRYRVKSVVTELKNGKAKLEIVQLGQLEFPFMAEVPVTPYPQSVMEQIVDFVVNNL